MSMHISLIRALLCMRSTFSLMHRFARLPSCTLHSGGGGASGPASDARYLSSIRRNSSTTCASCEWVLLA